MKFVQHFRAKYGAEQPELPGWMIAERPYGPAHRLARTPALEFMNRHVNAISGRLSLRARQRRSLEILDRITEIVPPQWFTANLSHAQP